MAIDRQGQPQQAALQLQAGSFKTARLYGAELDKLPADLYIPPEALEVFLEAFEGPLDLLLYLIRRQDFNIFDIPLATLTEQYLVYVDAIRESNLELAAEYLLMAAILIEIKSRMLLPPKQRAQDDQPDDPRADLVRRLIEYEQMKQAAQDLSQMPRAGRDFWPAKAWLVRPVPPNLPQVTALDMQKAWTDLLRRAALTQRHAIVAETLSVRDYMGRILRKIRGKSFIGFDALFESKPTVAVVVVTFVALLELVKEGLVEVSQGQPYAPIYLRCCASHSDTDEAVILEG